MIKTYNEFNELNQLNEGNLKNSFIVSLIAMSLLNSCQLFRHHKTKEKEPVETSLTNYDDNTIADEVYKKWGISSGNIKPSPVGTIVSTADFVPVPSHFLHKSENRLSECTPPSPSQSGHTFSSGDDNMHPNNTIINNITST